MSDLQKLIKTFDEIEVPYIIDDIGGGWIMLYTNKTRNIFFEFRNGKLASSP